MEEAQPLADGGRPRARRSTASLIILGTLCVALSVTALVVGGPARLGGGFSEAGNMLITLGPQLALGFLMAGLVTVLVPASAVAQLVGKDSGFQGLLIATAAGALTPGGPFLQFPLVAALLRSGAGEGAVAAYLTAWSLLGMQRVLVWEFPILGPTFAIARWTSALVLPILVGLTLPIILRIVRSI